MLQQSQLQGALVYRVDDTAIIAPQHPDLIARYCEPVKGDIAGMPHGIVVMANGAGVALDEFPGAEEVGLTR